MRSVVSAAATPYNDGANPGAAAASTAAGTTAMDGSMTSRRAGESRLVVRNEAEGYDLHGILTVKHEGSTSVWVLCHGLCSSCDGTVPRFVSKKLNVNTCR